MSLESSLGFFLDGLIVVLLASAIGFGFVLNRRLTALRKATEDANRMVGGFDAATKAARASVDALDAAGKDTGRQLQDQINTARKLRDELQFLTGAGEKTLSGIQPLASEPTPGSPGPRSGPTGQAAQGASLAETRALELAAEVTREAEKSAENLEPTEAERELREALRHVK